MLTEETCLEILLSSQSVDCSSYKFYLCVCLSVCVCVCECPAFTTYSSLTMGRILIKHGENVGTLVRLVVSKFHKNQFSVDVIMMSFLTIVKARLTHKV